MAWERTGDGQMSRELVPTGTLVAFAGTQGWSVWDDSLGEYRRVARGASDSMGEAMEQVDAWAWEQGYRPERSEGER